MLEKFANDNLKQRILENSYPGRGIVLGRDIDGDWVQIYWIMGRSTNSRNRVFVLDGDLLRTQVADSTQVSDPSLIIYNAMRISGNQFIVSNGMQTDSIWHGLENNIYFTDILREWQYEPDAPNYTPRISGCIDYSQGDGLAWLSILKRSGFDEDTSERHYYYYDYIRPGFGYAITTYDGDGDPLPSFYGTPYILPLPRGIINIAQHYWANLNEENRISLAVRKIDKNNGEFETHIINRNVASKHK